MYDAFLLRTTILSMIAFQHVGANSCVRFNDCWNDAATKENPVLQLMQTARFRLDIRKSVNQLPMNAFQPLSIHAICRYIIIAPSRG
jgi:hypothetical protein